MNNQIGPFLDLVRQEIQKYAILKKYSEIFEEKTGMNFEYLLCGVAFVLLFMLFSGFGASLICHIAAFAYPFYATLVVLSSSGNVK